MSAPLILVSSRTGNTRILAEGVRRAFPTAIVLDAAAAPDSLEAFDPILIGFWCDRGRAPEEIERLMPRIRGKRIGFFATMGGDPASPRAQEWMRRTCRNLAALGAQNVVQAQFLSRGRIDPALFERMSAGSAPSPEREARRRESETHPDRLDLLEVEKIFREAFVH